MRLADDYRDFDALRRFGAPDEARKTSTANASAVLCCAANASRPIVPAFGTRCTPEHPLGVTMVSSEGACAAYYRYRGARSLHKQELRS